MLCHIRSKICQVFILGLVFFLGGICIVSDVTAQWSIVAPQLVTPTPDKHRGAMTFRDGIAWIATQNVYSSTDSGQTWSLLAQNPFGGTASDLQFFDVLNGVAATEFGAFITRDGGLNWTILDTIKSNSACFVNSTTAFAIASITGNDIEVTTDGGISWNASNLPSWSGALKVLALRDGRILLQAGNLASGGGHIYTSSDNGLSWQHGIGQVDQDSWSFAVDSCDQNRIYVTSDDALGPTGPTSKIFVTSDGGTSWQIPIARPLPFFCGSVELGSSAAYCQTITDGMYRSTDRGATWQPNGGPSNVFDTRMVAAINNNIVLAVDSNGSVWRTMNGGGDSVLSKPSIPSTVQFVDSLTPCQTATNAIRLFGSECTPLAVRSIQLTGMDAKYFSTTGTSNLDSLLLTFAPDSACDYHAALILTLADRTTRVITLSGFGRKSPNNILSSSTTLFASDSVQLCGRGLLRSLLIRDSSCQLHHVISEKIIGPDSLHYQIVDSGAVNLDGSIDSITLSFSADSARPYNATLILTLNDSSTIVTSLLGTGLKNLSPFSTNPTKLFLTDTIAFCNHTIKGNILLRDTACPRHIVSEQIIGRDSLYYRIVDSGQTALGEMEDTIGISFSPDSPRSYTGALLITLDDSSRITIPLAGIGRTVSYPIFYSPNLLFAGDTSAECAPALIETILIGDSSCPPRRILTETIRGRDSLNYRIIEPFDTTSGRSLDSTTIIFQPDSARQFAGSVQLTFSDGSTLSIQLAGVGKTLTPITLSSLPIPNDTIGATVFVPIIIHSVGLSGLLTFSIYFDTSILSYQGTYVANQQTDQTISRTSGFARVRFDTLATSQDSLIGYAVFQIYPTNTPCTTVLFDSSSIVSKTGIACASMNTSFTSTICSSVGCGTPTLSHFIRYDKVPTLSIVPNPSSGIATLSSNGDLGDVTIEIYDMLGVLRLSWADKISTTHSVSINTASMPSGLYSIRVTTPGFARSLNFLHVR